MGSVTSDLESGRSKSASSPKIAICFRKNTSQQIADIVGISKVSAFRFLRSILIMKKESTSGPYNCSMRSKNWHSYKDGAQTFEMVSKI